MSGIDVQVTEHGPTEFCVELMLRDGTSVALERCEPLVQEIEELAFDEVLHSEVRPLPAGAIRVRIPADERGVHPPSEEVAHAVARRILA